MKYTALNFTFFPNTIFLKSTKDCFLKLGFFIKVDNIKYPSKGSKGNKFDIITIEFLHYLCIL